jgi:GT2 family glycosyltransferase
VSGRPSISIVVLTFNRKQCIAELLRDLAALRSHVLEILVVDNASSDGTDTLVGEFPHVTFLRNDRNLGACGRNRGMQQAQGDILVTLDDDVGAPTPAGLAILADCFLENPKLGVLNFRVVDAVTGAVCNWVHHRPATHAAESFVSYEITEGAAAFRGSALREVGYYWEPYFIGQEGVDLSLRLMDAGYEVRYDGRIAVAHKHEQTSRASWRFYYYDTRNKIWLALRRMPWWFATQYLLVRVPAMAFYSLRDGFLKYWFKGVFDALKESPAVLRTRQPMLARTEAIVRGIDRERPRFWQQARKRLFQPANRLDA